MEVEMELFLAPSFKLKNLETAAFSDDTARPSVSPACENFDFDTNYLSLHCDNHGLKSAHWTADRASDGRMRTGSITHVRFQVKCGASAGDWLELVTYWTLHERHLRARLGKPDRVAQTPVGTVIKDTDPDISRLGKPGRVAQTPVGTVIKDTDPDISRLGKPGRVAQTPTRLGKPDRVAQTPVGTVIKDTDPDISRLGKPDRVAQTPVGTVIKDTDPLAAPETSPG
ncbi:hypothetical protein RRG08_032491 [Elysia crispata]|uniref:Uncharacterized protein n=1 Tax=Elysia crispata TaxID=231223 RepID=A0AAE0ZYR0_9GAST|nr:hypothetical protein RRG08_032491 [Elysia crispata]